jgi:hypothetical protein
MINSQKVRWHLHAQKTCLLALAADKPDVFHRECNFVSKRQDIKPIYLELIPGTYVISNITDMFAKCPSYRRPPTTDTCVPCLIHMGCSCFIATRETTLLTAQTLRLYANFTSVVDVRYAVNLAILKSFYDLANSSLTGKTLWSPGRVPEHQPLELKFFGDSSEKYWATDEAAI